MDKLEIDACIGSELKDSQGETLSIEGADITDLQNGEGRWNDNHGKGFFNSLGRITYAKKIFGLQDIENDRQRYYWDKVKSPYIYAAGYLYNDDEDHLNAKAAAAVLKNLHKTDAPLKIKASVEGGVVSRGIKDSSILSRTKIHSVALTFTPANSATLVEPTSLTKSVTKQEQQLIKSVIHLAKDNVPSFIDISNQLRMKKIEDNVKKINSLVKESKEIYLPQKNTGNIENKIKEKRDTMARDLSTYKVKPVTNMSPGTLDTEVHRVKDANEALKNTQVLRHSRQIMKDNKGDYFKNLKDNHIKMGGKEEDFNEIRQGVVNFLSKPKDLSFKQHADNLSKLSLGKQQEYKEDVLNHITKQGAGNYYRDNIDEHLGNIINSVNKRGLNKAMFAGYSGCSSPMQQVSAAVIIPQSLEGRGFRYVTCDDCGEEQVHTKNQIKCRKCGKGFSMRKIYNTLNL